MLPADFRARIQEVVTDLRLLDERGECWDICYLHVHPAFWRGEGGGGAGRGAAAVPVPGAPSLVRGYFTWCLLGYIVSRRGARRLDSIFHRTRLSQAIDNCVSALAGAGVLTTLCLSRRLVESAGEATAEARSGLASNIWSSDEWAGAIDGTGADRKERMEVRGEREREESQLRIWSECAW